MKKIIIMSETTDDRFFFEFTEEAMQYVTKIASPVYYDTVEAAMAEVEKRGLPPGLVPRFATVEVVPFKQEKIDA